MWKKKSLQKHYKMGMQKEFQFVSRDVSWMKATCAMLQMIYEKKQSLKRSGDRRQEALEEQKGRYQSKPGNRESHAEQLLCLLGWRCGCNHAGVLPTLAVNTERLGIPFPLLGRDIMWKYGKEIML